MEINGIVLSPDPRLRQECAEVEEINSDLRALVERMKVQMFENGGCGLAAPQVGETIQLAIVDTEYTSEKRLRPLRPHQSGDRGAVRQPCALQRGLPVHPGH